MKYVTLLLVLASIGQGSELVRKATLVDEILSKTSATELIENFEKTNMLGASFQTIRAHGNGSGNLDKKLAGILRESMENSAIKSFTADELTLLKELHSGNASERGLALKTLSMTISQNPQSIQKFSGVLMQYSQGAFDQVRETSREKTILNNLRMIASGADQYFLEEGKTTVEVTELIGPDAYIKKITPVAEESYPKTISTSDEKISATLPDGETISIDF